MNVESYFKKIRDIKLSGKKVYTNCIKSPNELENAEVLCDEYSIIFLKNNHEGANRVYFYTWELSKLNELLKKCSFGTVLEIVTKNEDDYMEQITKSGFDCIAKMIKVSNPDIGELFHSEVMEQNENNCFTSATIEDVDDIYRLLHATFTPQISHLPSKNELIIKVQNNEFLLVKSRNNTISSLLQQVVKPRSYYFNQVINKGDKKLFHKMIKSELYDYYLNGGKQVYAWVEENNIASVRFFEKYGLRDTGLRTLIYEKK